MSDPADDRDRFDLNLMQVFDVVMTERHVTRAAERLGLTQSAVSNALNRLRLRLGDPLFNKAARGVTPTPKALQLWPKVHDALLQMRSVYDESAFNPASSMHQFRVAISDLSASLLTPLLYQRMSGTSPGSSVTCIPFEPSLAESMLLRGEVDFSIGNTPFRVSSLQSSVLWRDHYVVAARRSHPLLEKPITPEALCAADHLSVHTSRDTDAPSIIDEALGQFGLRRNIKLVVNQFSIVCRIVQHCDLIAILPSRLVPDANERERIEIRDVPFNLPNPEVHLTWHKRSQALPAYSWFRRTVIDTAKEIGPN